MSKDWVKEAIERGYCTIRDVVIVAVDNYLKSSDVKSPLKTNIFALDYLVGKVIKPIGGFNKLFNVGKAAASVEKSVDDLCRSKNNKE